MSPKSLVASRDEFSRALADRYRAVRQQTHDLVEPLETEDFVVQSMPDASPAKWHLAHTSWFFETFLLKAHLPDYKTPNEAFNFLFNSYYNTVGKQHSRPQRGLLSRPTVSEVMDYRDHVDAGMEQLLAGADEALLSTLSGLIEIGVQHEQQHQELLITDIKHLFSCNPLKPAYRDIAVKRGEVLPDMDWVSFDEGLYEIGHHGDGFGYDNEHPRHRVFLEGFALACRLVTNNEFKKFIAAGGYQDPQWWLSEGWNIVQSEGWVHPEYWERREGEWWNMTLSGMRPLEDAEPVCHVSYFEADAYARWAGARLATEAEWEVGAERALRQKTDPVASGNFVDDQRFHPRALNRAVPDSELAQMFGDVWEWTQSQYTAYPGYRAGDGALGEYNGKFMSNQFVLRGGSVATSRNHIRASYRNFFPAHARWQFSGIRLAK